MVDHTQLSLRLFMIANYGQSMVRLYQTLDNFTGEPYGMRAALDIAKATSPMVFAEHSSRKRKVPVSFENNGMHKKFIRIAPKPMATPHRLNPSLPPPPLPEALNLQRVSY